MQDKPKLLIVNEFHSETVAQLDSLFETEHLWEHSDQSKRELIKSLEGNCKAVATASWVFDDLAYQLNSLELIACFGVGVDAINFETTQKRRIKVTNTPDVLNDSVADVAMALILATTCNIIKADNFVRAGSWEKGPFPFGRGLSGRTLGIVGLGRIGKEIAHRALPFKLNIAYHNRSPRNLPYSYYPSINELAVHSDILLCVLPGGAATDNIIDESVFESLGPGGIFINVGRGSSVDEAALINALSSKRIAGAGLDVYADEPIVPESLLNLDNVVLFPHIGTSNLETRLDMGKLVIKNLQAYFEERSLLSEFTKT